MDPTGENKKIIRQRISLREKWDAVKRMEEGDSSLAIAKELGINQKVVQQWISVKDKLKKWYETSPENVVGANRKNLSQVYNQQLDEIVYFWYVKCVKQGIPVTGPMIRLKAMEFKEQLGASWIFQAISDSWLHKWRKQHRITINPEQLFVSEEPCQIFSNKFKTLIEQENLTPDQIFICCETFLCHKLPPSKSFDLGNFSDNQHDRLSIVVCCNATGNLKLPPMIIGKEDDEKYENNTNSKMDNITYKNQKFSWLDKDIFHDWFIDEFVPTVGIFLDEKSLSQKAVLILDDHSVLLDENILQVGDIKTMYLLPKVTRLIRMEESILENIKRRYRYQFLTRLHFAIKNGGTVTEYLNEITINKILHWLATSWNEIKPFTISSLWNNVLTEMKVNTRCSEFDSSPTNLEFLTILQKLPEFANLDNNDLEDWFYCDRIMPSISDEDFIIEVQKTFSEIKHERREAPVVPDIKTLPSRRCKRRKEDQNSNESVNATNFQSFDKQSKNASNEISSLPVDVNSDSNVMSPASNMNDSTIEHQKKEKKKTPNLSKEREEKNFNESVDIKKQESDDVNEVEAFCKRLAGSLRRLSPKIRSRVEIDILKVIYEAEFGEKV